MKSYRNYYYEIDETNLTYIVEIYTDRQRSIKIGSTEINKTGIIGELDLDNFAKECIDDIYAYEKGWIC